MGLNVDTIMQEEEDIYKAIDMCNEVAKELDENGNPAEAAGPIILQKALLWVVEESENDLIEELEQDVDEIIGE